MFGDKPVESSNEIEKVTQQPKEEVSIFKKNEKKLPTDRFIRRHTLFRLGTPAEYRHDHSGKNRNRALPVRFNCTWWNRCKLLKPFRDCINKNKICKKHDCCKLTKNVYIPRIFKRNVYFWRYKCFCIYKSFE